MDNLICSSWIVLLFSRRLPYQFLVDCLVYYSWSALSVLRCFPYLFLERFASVVHSKLLMSPTDKFVFSRTQHFCHIWKTHVCVDLTQVPVLKWQHVSYGTRVVISHNTPKRFLPPVRNKPTNSCPRDGCPIPWAISDTPYDNITIILIVALRILYIIKVQHLYVYLFIYNQMYIEVNYVNYI